MVISYRIKTSPLIFAQSLLDEPTQHATVRRELGLLMDLKLLFISHANYETNSWLCTVAVVPQGNQWIHRTIILNLHLPRTTFT